MSGRSPAGPGLRVGPAEIVKGGARVETRPVEGTAAQPDTMPAIPEAESAQAGLFVSRLIEFGETRRETVVAARPFVREEIVVGKSIGRRVERIEETVRRTEVEVEQVPPRVREENPEAGAEATGSARVERGTQ